MPVATRRGGAELTLLHLLMQADASTRWCVVFLEDGPMVDEVQRLGVTALVVRTNRVRDLRTSLRAIHDLADAIRRWKPHIVLSWMTKGHLYAGPIAAYLGIPAVWFQHGFPKRGDPIDRVATLLPARAGLSPSEAVSVAQMRLGPRRPVNGTYPGVDAGAVGPRRAEILEQLALPAE